MTLPAHEVPGAKLSHTAAAGQPRPKPIATDPAKNTPQPSPSCQAPPHPSSPADRERQSSSEARTEPVRRNAHARGTPRTYAPAGPRLSSRQGEGDSVRARRAREGGVALRALSTSRLLRFGPVSPTRTATPAPPRRALPLALAVPRLGAILKRNHLATPPRAAGKPIEARPHLSWSAAPSPTVARVTVGESCDLETS